MKIVAMKAETHRLDRWLWFARFFRSRAAASRFCLAGKVRVNRVPVAKPDYEVRIGDVLTFVAPGDRLCIVRVLALGHRRGPAAEARGLYEGLDRTGAVARG